MKTLRHFHAVALAASLLSLSLEAGTSGPTFELVAEAGDAAPGLSGVTFLTVSSPQLNDSGDVAFRGLLTGMGVTFTSDEVICIRTGGAVTIAVREGGMVGDQPGLTLGALSQHFKLSAEGEVIFVGQLSGAGVTAANDGAVFAAKADGTVRTLVREGEAIGATGLIVGAAAFEIFASGAAPPLVAPDENENDEPDLVAFRPGGWVSTAGVPGTDVRAMLYLRDGEVRVAAKAGDVIPLPAEAARNGPGGTFTLAPPLSAVGTPRGTTTGFTAVDIAFTSGSSTSNGVSAGVLVCLGDGSVKPVRVAGQNAPGGKSKITEIEAVSVSNSGVEMAALAKTQKPGSSTSARTVLELKVNPLPLAFITPGSVASEKKAAPKGGKFQTLGPFLTFDPRLGSLLLPATLEPDGDSALYGGLDGRLRYPVAREGKKGPEGEKILSVSFSGEIGAGLVYNRTAFFASLPGASPVQALIVSDLGAKKAVSQVLARTGEAINVGVDGTRTPLFLIPPPGSTVARSSTAGEVTLLNAVGQITFAANLAGGTGLFFCQDPPPVVYQPDLIVKSAVTSIGNDVHEKDAKQQVALVTLARGESIDLELTIQNDGTVEDSFDLSAKTPILNNVNPGAQAEYIVKIMKADNTDVTNQVLHPKGKVKFPVGPLAPDASETLKLKITVPANLNAKLLDKNNEIKIKFKAVSRGSEEKEKPEDNFEIVVRVTNP